MATSTDPMVLTSVTMTRSQAEYLNQRVAFQPTDNFSALITADMTRDRENGPAMELIGIDFTDLSQLQGVVLAPPPPMAFIHNVTTAAMGPGQPCAATDPAGNGVTSNPASSQLLRRALHRRRRH